MNYFGLCNVLSTDLCASCCSFGFEYFPLYAFYMKIHQLLRFHFWLQCYANQFDKRNVCGGGKKMIKNLYLKCTREIKKNSPKLLAKCEIKQGNLCCDGKVNVRLLCTVHEFTSSSIRKCKIKYENTYTYSIPAA